METSDPSALLILLCFGLLIPLGLVGLVLIVRRGGAETRPNPEMPLPTSLPPSNLSPNEEIQWLLAQGNKLQAIKRVRELTGLGLKEAKEYVELYPNVTPLADLGPAPSSSAREVSLDEEVRSLLAQGKKIEAIKEVRERTGMGLKEAKEYVDALEGQR